MSTPLAPEKVARPSGRLALLRGPAKDVPGLSDDMTGRAHDQRVSADDKVVVNGMRKIFYPGAAIVPIEVPMDAPNTVVAAPGPADAADGATTADDTAEG
jgi:hypothetical protein